jgi:hypothetical protein
MSLARVSLACSLGFRHRLGVQVPRWRPGTRMRVAACLAASLMAHLIMLGVHLPGRPPPLQPEGVHVRRFERSRRSERRPLARHIVPSLRRRPLVRHSR